MTSYFLPRFNSVKAFLFLIAALLLSLCFLPPAHAAPPRHVRMPDNINASISSISPEYDVIVAGGGVGGLAAALQAYRLGASVLIVEPSAWIGGQALAAGVTTMDDMSHQRSGIYLEYITKMRRHYDSIGKSMGTCYWYPGSIAFEPTVGLRFMYEMLSEARTAGKKPFDILTQTEITQVKRDGLTVVGVTVQDRNGAKRDVVCRVLIDATEYGDVIPLAGVAYRSGNSVTPFLNMDARIQDITWLAIIKSYPHGIPPHLIARTQLPGYELAKRNFETFVARDGHNFRFVFPVELPVNFISHNAYRGLPDSSNPRNYDGSRENWRYISKTGVNWPNDFPGRFRWEGRSGLPVRYLEDREFRAAMEREAFIKTLHFIYYMQNELGESWSIADDEYYSPELPAFVSDLPQEWHEIAKRMPPIPYVRESRRILGDFTLCSAELLRNSLNYRDGQTSHEFHDAIAIGGYFLDLHGSTSDVDMELDLNEREASIDLNRPRGPFQVPMRILIPQRIEGFLAAEKNLSMSRLTSGALRLQPICMMVGQAAGALAAISIQSGLHLREVSPVKVQRALLEAGVLLSLSRYSDVPPEHPYFRSVQLSNLHRLIDPLVPPSVSPFDIRDLDNPALARGIARGTHRGIFGVDETLTYGEMVSMLNRARAAAQASGGQPREEGSEPDRFVTLGIFADAVCRAFGFYDEATTHTTSMRRFVNALRILNSLGIFDLYDSGRELLYAFPISRGQAVEILMKAMTVN